MHKRWKYFTTNNFQTKISNDEFFQTMAVKQSNVQKVWKAISLWECLIYVGNILNIIRIITEILLNLYLNTV